MFKLDIKKYFESLQSKIGETRSADKILEGPWWEVVVRELNQMSYYCARELQLETDQPYPKDFSNGTRAYNLPYEEAPPTRLLAMNLILSYWLGWLDASGTHGLNNQPISGWKRIEESYKNGYTQYQQDYGSKNT